MRLGVMQGRLSSRDPRRPGLMQFFPDDWEREFAAAAAMGLDEVEVVADSESPSWPAGLGDKVAKAAERTGVRVRHVMADFILDHPLHAQPYYAIRRVMTLAKEMGAETVELPLIERNSMLLEALGGPRARHEGEDFIFECAEMARPIGLDIGIETDLPPAALAWLVGKFDGHVLVNYDTGNSAAAGHDVTEEMAALLPRIRNIHIKDRLPNGGPTVTLGIGCADFDKLFSILRLSKYDGSLTLQAARWDVDGKDEADWVADQVSFVKGKMNGLGT